jgi:hypothetical protein
MITNFVLTFVTTSILLILENWKFEKTEFPIFNEVLNSGQYSDTNPMWYAFIGSIFIKTYLIGTVLQVIMIAYEYI